MYKLSDILENNTQCSSCGRSKKLYEAYSERIIQGFLDRFKEQADDLNLDVTDSELKSYIKTFDKIKEKLPGDKRDLNKWKVGDFIRFVTTRKGGEKDEAEEIDITPDVVYHNDNDTIVVYNGSTEGNCVKFGKGEEWCITRTSFPSYRYSSGRGYPTFYLAKNNNLPSSNELSFVAIQVRDPQKTRDTERYVYTNRKNRPYESDPMSLTQLTSEIPWLKDIPNLQSVLKYIPLSSAEKVSHQYRNTPISYREWTKLPYNVKEQYLVVRKDARSSYGSSSNEIFTDISDNEFVSQHLKKYPDVLKFVAETPEVIRPEVLVRNLNDLPDSARKSITANLHTPIKDTYLQSSAIPFDTKKLLVKLKKWELEPNERLYVTQDGDTIVKLNLGDDLSMGLYQAEDDYPSVKINKRTSKFLLDYPELGTIPLSLLVKLTEKGAIDSSIPKKVIDDAKKDPNSPIAVKETEDGDVIIDSSTLSAYKLKNGRISTVPFTDEQVQSVFKDAQESDSFKKNTLNLFTGQSKDLPVAIDTNGLASIINSLPYSERTMPIKTASYGDPVEAVALVDSETNNIFFMKASPESGRDFLSSERRYEGNKVLYGKRLNTSQLVKYSEYLRSKGTLIDDETLKSILASSGGYTSTLKDFLNSNPPLDPNNALIPVVDQEGTIYMLNTANRRLSYKISPSTGNLVNAPLSQGRYDQLYRTARPQQAAAQEPTAPQQAPAAQGQQAATRWQQPAPTGDINIANTMNTLGAANQFRQIPTADLRRLNITNGAPLNTRTDGGARRRNQLLGNAGQVTNAYAALTSRIYVIRLTNGTNVISIKVYPGNREYLLIPGQTALQLNEPSDLLRALRQRNLAEASRYLIRSYMDTNPTNLEEFKQILRTHINK